MKCYNILFESKPEKTRKSTNLGIANFKKWTAKRNLKVGLATVTSEKLNYIW